MTQRRGLGPATLRQHNRKLLLRLLRDGPTSRAKLALDAGLTPSTITNAVNELITDGLVSEFGVVSSADVKRLGRPPTAIALAASARNVLAAQFGVGMVNLARCDLVGTVLERRTVRFDLATPAAVVLESVGAGLMELRKRSRTPVLGIGVGAIGPVDADRRVNLVAVNLGWRDVPIADILGRKLRLPVVVDHNVRAMAIGESRYGLGRGIDNLAFVYLRTGVGAGLILGGKPYRGAFAGTTEIGHVHVATPGLPCTCGSRGCLETVVSEPVLAEQATRAAGRGSGRIAARIQAGEDPLDALVEAAREGDGIALGIVHDAAENLGIALGDLVNLMNPEVLVLGGFFSIAGDLLVTPVRTAIRRRAFPLLADRLRVELTAFGQDAGVVGAGALALDAFFYEQESAPAARRTRRSSASA